MFYDRDPFRVLLRLSSGFYWCVGGFTSYSSHPPPPTPNLLGDNILCTIRIVSAAPLARLLGMCGGECVEVVRVCEIEWAWYIALRVSNREWRCAGLSFFKNNPPTTVQYRAAAVAHQRAALSFWIKPCKISGPILSVASSLSWRGQSSWHFSQLEGKPASMMWNFEFKFLQKQITPPPGQIFQRAITRKIESGRCRCLTHLALGAILSRHFRNHVLRLWRSSSCREVGRHKLVVGMHCCVYHEKQAVVL